MKKIISFDIWDTIIKRNCHPEEIKLKTAYYIYLKYNKDLKDEYKDIYKILKLRDSIEEKLCKESKKDGFDEECRIENVFDELIEEILDKKTKLSTSELLKVEIQNEKKSIYINPDILDIFEEYKDYEMYCVSDFYMSDTSLRELLNYLELPVKIKKIYSSADYLLNKKSGKLFKKFEEDLGISPEEHIHVGDNQYSDIEVAQSLGISTIKMEKEHIDFDPNRNRCINYNLNDIRRKKDGLFNAGLELTPLLYYFVYDIIEYAIKNEIDTVYYQTREGETFIKIHDLIKMNNPFSVDVPEGKVMEVSRMATFAASLNELSIDELKRLWSQYRKQSMYALFKTLNIDIKEYEEYFKKYDIDIKEDIEEPWKDKKVKKLFDDKEFTKSVNSKLKDKRTELLKYFDKKLNIKNDKGRILVVDIGWRGTIQDNIAYIFDKKEVDGYYLTLFDFYNVQPKNVTKHAFIDDKEIRDKEVGSIITLLEWIYNPGTASVTEYKDGESIRKAKTQELQVVEQYIKPLQEGMFAGAEVINEYMKHHAYEASETKQLVYELIKSIKAKPKKALIEAYYSMVFNDTFGTAEYVEKENKLTLLEKLNVIKCRNILRSEDWKEAFMVYNGLQYMQYVLNFKAMIRKILKRK